MDTTSEVKKDPQQGDKKCTSTPPSPHASEKRIPCGIGCEVLAFTTYLFVLKALYEYTCDQMGFGVYVEAMTNSMDGSDALIVGSVAIFATLTLYETVKFIFRFVGAVTDLIHETLTNCTTSTVGKWKSLGKKTFVSLKRAFCSTLSWMLYPVMGLVLCMNALFSLIGLLGKAKEATVTLMENVVRVQQKIEKKGQEGEDESETKVE